MPVSKLVPGWFAAVALAAAAPMTCLAAPPQFTLHIAGIQGESTLSVAKGDIDVLSFNFGASFAATVAAGGGVARAGKPDLTTLSILKTVDHASVPLFAQLLKGVHGTLATLTVWESNGETLQAAYTVTLKNFLVADQSTTGSVGSPLTESVSFTYDEIKVTDIIGGGLESVDFNVLTGVVQ